MAPAPTSPWPYLPLIAIRFTLSCALADFGKVTFTNASATAGGHAGSISDSDWSAQPVELSPTSSTGFLGASGAYDVVGGGSPIL